MRWDLETAQTNTTAKLPLLKQGEYDMWKLRIEQYFQVQDYALWDVIDNGNSFKPAAQTTTNAEGTSTTLVPGPVTADEKTQKKNDVKARSMLLMALPNEHLLTFNQYKDAKTLFAAIQTRFGGNDATKKTQKTLLKKMYENFSAPSTESLDSIFNRLQKIWNTHVMVWRNKPDLDIMSFDDLHNNFKIIKQEVKGTANSSSSSSSQNMAFVSSLSSTNEVNTAYAASTDIIQVSTTSTQVSTASTQVSTNNLSDATVYAFLANQPNESHLVHEDLEQIHEDDLEEIDLKWQLALLSMRTRRLFRKLVERSLSMGVTQLDMTSPRSCFDCELYGRCGSPSNMALWLFQTLMGQIPDKSRKGVGFVSYNAVPPLPTGLFAPPTLDMSNSDDKLKKKTVFPTVSKIEFVRPQHKEKLVRKQVKAVLMKTGLRTLNTAKPVNTAHPKTIVYSARPMPKIVNTARPNTAVVNAVRANQTLQNSIEDMLPLGEEPKEEELLMCDKKNSVLFTNTEYFVQSPDFKLADESTNSNNFLGTKESIGAGQSNKETGSSQDYILMPMWKDGLLFDSSSKNASNDEPQPSSDAGKKDDESKNKESGINDQEIPKISSPDVNTVGPNINIASINTGSLNINTASPTVITAPLEATHADFFGDETELDMSNISTTYQVPSTSITRIHKDHSLDNVIGDVLSSVQLRRMTKTTNEQGFISVVYEGKTHEDLHTCLFACFLSQEEPKRIAKALMDLPKGKRAIGTKWIFRNKKDKRGIIIRNKARLVAQGYTQEEGIDYDEVFTPVARIEAIRLFLAYASFMGFMVYQIDVNISFLFGIIEEEVYVDDIIFGSTKKELCTEFEKLMHDKFQMSSMGELTFFLGLQVKQKEDGIFISQDKYVAKILRKFSFTDVKTTSTPMDTDKPLLKDLDGDDVDVHLYRSMIGSLMYLTSSRPDIMYLKGQPKLGLWYPRDSSFDLVAYSDSDYAGASLDRKATGMCLITHTIFHSKRT
ncbi:putative ribonuclease H-like domain-containing protein [Tanacetum coccineum]